MPYRAYSKTYAWLTDGMNTAYKLDVDSSKIVQTVVVNQGISTSSVVQDNKSTIVEDRSSNLLMLIYDYPSRFAGQGVKVFNLKGFGFKKDLGVTSQDPNSELPRVLVPPVGAKFYVIWWNTSKAVNGEGGETYSVYDKATLNKIADLSSFPIDLGQPIMFSSDGTKLYGINTDKNEIKVYESSTLSLLSTISIANVWGTPLYMKSVVPDTSMLVRGDKLFFEENIKNTKSDPNNVKYFVYDITTKAISRKFSIQEVSNEYLTPDGSKIVTSEISYTYRGTSVAGINHLNKIHIYEVVTGRKLKDLDLNSRYKGVIFSGISPDSQKLYLAARNVLTSASTIIVIELKTYNIIAEIPVQGSLAVFFEE